MVKDGPPEIVSPDHFRAMLESDPGEVLVVGEVEGSPEATFLGLHRVKLGRPRFPDAAALLYLAAGPLEKDGYPPAEDVRPLYLREPDVNISWKQFRKEGPWESSASA